jgi:hypothetical protein
MVSDRQLWWLEQGTKRPGPLATVDRDALATAVAEIKELRARVAQLEGNNGTGTVDQRRDT